MCAPRLAVQTSDQHQLKEAVIVKDCGDGRTETGDYRSDLFMMPLSTCQRLLGKGGRTSTGCTDQEGPLSGTVGVLNGTTIHNQTENKALL